MLQFGFAIALFATLKMTGLPFPILQALKGSMWNPELRSYCTCISVPTASGQPAIWPWVWSMHPAGFGLPGCQKGVGNRVLSGDASSVIISDLCTNVPLFHYPQTLVSSCISPFLNEKMAGSTAVMWERKPVKNNNNNPNMSHLSRIYHSLVPGCLLMVLDHFLQWNLL